MILSAPWPINFSAPLFATIAATFSGRKTVGAVRLDQGSDGRWASEAPRERDAALGTPFSGTGIDGTGALLYASGFQVCIGARPALVP